MYVRWPLHKAARNSRSSRAEMDTANKLTIAQMKMILKNHQMTTSGTKAELAARIRSANPTGEWMSEVDDLRGDQVRNVEEGHSGNEDSMVQDREQKGRDRSRVMQGMHLHRESMDAHNEILLRELELARRERDLMERELRGS